MNSDRDPTAQMSHYKVQFIVIFAVFPGIEFGNRLLIQCMKNGYFSKSRMTGYSGNGVELIDDNRIRNYSHDSAYLVCKVSRNHRSEIAGMLTVLSAFNVIYHCIIHYINA